jgi:hypothetical protein
MLQAFKNWPNTTLAIACVCALGFAFLLGIATAPGAHRTALLPTSHESGSTQPVGLASQPALHEDRYIDYSVVYPQYEP